MDQPPPKSWSIHTRREIITKYQILERVGSGAYSDVYKARRLSDSVIVALKEVHDYQSAFREIEALQTLQHSPNVVVLHEYFWREDEDAVLVLEFLQTDLASVIRGAKKEGKGGLSVGEIKRWMVQILCGVDACHRSSIVHRDLKPSNLLVSADGVLKLADFGQARILLESADVCADDNANEEEIHDSSILVELLEIIPQKKRAGKQGRENLEQGFLPEKDRDGLLEEIRAKDPYDEVDTDFNIHDANTSCVATCNNSELEDDFPRSSYSYEGEECVNDRYGQLTSCVGTRWFRAPELLYGSTSYGPEIDLWSLGCIFSELFSLEPIFPGTSDIDQLSRIFNVLGNLTEEAWPSCTKLPDYQIISFGKVENPTGIEACLPNRSPDEIFLIKKLLCFYPASRATAMELLHEKYLNEEPLPVPISQLRVSSSSSGQNNGSSGESGNYRDGGSDSDFEEFGLSKYTKTDAGFSIQFL